MRKKKETRTLTKVFLDLQAYFHFSFVDVLNDIVYHVGIGQSIRIADTKEHVVSDTRCLIIFSRYEKNKESFMLFSQTSIPLAQNP